VQTGSFASWRCCTVLIHSPVTLVCLLEDNRSNITRMDRVQPNPSRTDFKEGIYNESMKIKSALFTVTLVSILAAVSCNKGNGPVREAVSNKEVYQEAYTFTVFR
jgi:hypothetical protein